MARRNSNGEPTGRAQHNHSHSSNTAAPPTGYSNHYSGIPFRDADPSTYEVPLDSLDNFIVPANDDSGHSDVVTFRLTPYLHRTLKLLVHSNRYPYLDVQDLIRHAVSRHTIWLISLRQSIPQHPRSGLAALEEICREEEWKIKAEEVYNRILSLLNYYVSRGETNDAMRLVTILKNRMATVEHSARSREFAERFQRQFGHHLQPGGMFFVSSQPVTEMETVEAPAPVPDYQGAEPPITNRRLQ